MNATLRTLLDWCLRWVRGPAGARTPAPSAGQADAPLALPPAPPLNLPLAPHASVVIPALNEAARIASVVRHVLDDPATAEVIVVDDSSIDDTAALARAAGARVITSSMLGKGESMRNGVEEVAHPLVVFLDGDLAGLRPGLVGDLCRPLLRDDADFVKARFGRSGGRVTELTAKPMLKVFFPELAHFAQPLGGLVAARTSLLKALSFENGYGVDIGLLIDAHRAGARLAEVDIGSLENDSQPLHDLTLMANEVSRVVYSRARTAGRLHVEQIVAMYETQRQATAELPHILSRRRGRTRLLLLDMDGTVTPERSVQALARATGHEAALAKLLDNGDDAATRSERIAALFKFVHQQQFDRVARNLQLRPGVIDCVNRFRRAGFMVGLVSDGYFAVAETVRRRIFADFALAHTLQFDSEVCTGQLRLNTAFLAPEGSAGPPVCKQHALQRLRDDATEPRLRSCWALGDNLNDLAMLRAADRGFAIDPKSAVLAQDEHITMLASFDQLSALLDDLPATA